MAETNDVPDTDGFDFDEVTSGLTSSFTGSLGSNVAANLLTLGVLGLGWAVKKLCSRNARIKSKCHTCCLAVSVVDRTQRSEQPPSISEDEPESNPV